MSRYLGKVALFTCLSVAAMLRAVEKLLPDWGMQLTVGTWLLFTVPVIAIELIGTAFVQSRGTH